MTSRVAIYARSSPDCPLSVQDQVEQLNTVADERGWTVAKVFSDRPVSARKCLDRRPGEMALIDAIRSGTINKILVWSVCRIGKSLAELVALMATCRSSGVSVYLHEQDTVASQVLFDMATLLSIHLRQTRRDRILRGQAAARSLSIKFGRPPLSATKMARAKHELAAGRGVRKTARLVGISAASVSRLKNSMGTATVSS